MRNLKTKLGLSVAALAFTFAGAINMQSTVTANADVDISGLSMMNGASVCLKDDFSGIRWTTKVDSTWFNATCVGNSYQFGVIVAPNVAAKDLTHETAGVKDLPVTGSLDASAQDVTYYSVIDYNNILENYTGNLTDEEVLAKAYALELTARAYVQLDGTYYYANMTGLNTSRSARQVAIAAELAGEIDADDTKAWEYYGEETQYAPAVKSIGAVGTAVIDMENPTATVEVSMEIAGTFQEALVGGQKVTATYADGTLSITDASGIPTGENYITVFTDAGVYTTPVIGATKVLTKMEDFDMFSYIRRNLQTNSSGTEKISSEIQEGVDASKCVQDGYYVLKNDIDATNYYMYDDGIRTGNDKASVGNGWYGVGDFKGKTLGLTGTFNGLGHKVDNLCSERNYSGLFELVNGGTIKNFALTNFKAYSKSSRACGFAYYAYDPVVENVYIHINGNFRGTIDQYAMFYYIHQTKEEGSVLKNVLLDVNYNVSYIGTENGLFAMMHNGSKKTFSWNNVYTIGNAGLCYTEDDSVIKYYAYGDNNVTADGYEIVGPKGVVVTDKTPTNAYYIKGANQYFSMDAFKTANHDLSGFANDPSGCWKVVDGVPVFGA